MFGWLERLIIEGIEPKVVIVQTVRGTGPLDVRNFFANPKVWELQEIIKPFLKMTNKEQAKALLNWVKTNIQHIQEKPGGDIWQFHYETLSYKSGDCEDLAILLANLLVAVGINYFKVRINVGTTSIGAHSWVTFYDGTKWQILDPSVTEIIRRETWFSWHAKQAFTTKEGIVKWQR